jgi:N-terminal half of MaoC dehydratase
MISAEAELVPDAGPAPGLLAHQRHNTRADSSAIRFWARTIGDRNPRYVSPSYFCGYGGRFQAHPCWLYSVHDTCIGAGHPGAVPVLAGTAWTFARAVRPGEEIATVARLAGERIVEGRFGGPTPVQRIEVRYAGPGGDPIATAVSTVFLVDPERARQRGKFAGWKRWRYTPRQLARIEESADAETARYARSAVPRYWEEVSAGQALTPIVRGPLTSEELTLFIGATRPARSAEAFTADRLAGRTASFLHPRTGVYETYEAGFVDDESAQQLGFPAAHDPGTDRISYLASLVTGWMGPAGELRALDVRLTEPHMMGGTSWCHGQVSELRRSSARSGEVIIDLRVIDQADRPTALGHAIVELPSRSADGTR